MKPEIEPLQCLGIESKSIRSLLTMSATEAELKQAEVRFFWNEPSCPGDFVLP